VCGGSGVGGGGVGGGDVGAGAEEDPYLTFVKTAPEFKPVKQDPGAWTNRWNTWVYMPWRFQWTIGTGDAGGQFCKD